MLTSIEARSTPSAQQFTRTVVPDPRLVSAVRNDIAMALRQWGVAELVDDAKILVSEVLTNAIQHAGGSQEITVLAAWTHPVLYVEVHDCDSTALAQVVLPAAATSTRGRGLPLVDALSSAWGSVPRQPDGKHVWFELRCSSV
jgi:anti-sigma regulatory factor (Ser/Thr protein kinase)